MDVSATPKEADRSEKRVLGLSCTRTSCGTHFACQPLTASLKGPEGVFAAGSGKEGSRRRRRHEIRDNEEYNSKHELILKLERQKATTTRHVIFFFSLLFDKPGDVSPFERLFRTVRSSRRAERYATMANHVMLETQPRNGRRIGRGGMGGDVAGRDC